MLIKLSGKNFQQARLKFTYVIWCYAMNKLYHLRRCHSCSIGRHKWFVCCETELEQKKKNGNGIAVERVPGVISCHSEAEWKLRDWDKIAHMCIRVAVSSSFAVFCFVFVTVLLKHYYPTHCKCPSQPSHGLILHRNTIIHRSAALDINEGNWPPNFSRALTLTFQLQ